MRREEIVKAMDELYKEGRLIKALDESGQPLLRNGQQVYIAKRFATELELALWRRENGTNRVQPKTSSPSCSRH